MIDWNTLSTDEQLGLLRLALKKWARPETKTTIAAMQSLLKRGLVHVSKAGHYDTFKITPEGKRTILAIPEDYEHSLFPSKRAVEEAKMACRIDS